MNSSTLQRRSWRELKIKWLRVMRSCKKPQMRQVLARHDTLRPTAQLSLELA